MPAFTGSKNERLYRTLAAPVSHRKSCKNKRVGGKRRKKVKKVKIITRLDKNETKTEQWSPIARKKNDHDISEL